MPSLFVCAALVRVLAACRVCPSLLQFQDGLTYMDWAFPLTGLDLGAVWDPELWLTFKEAVRWNTPEAFWDKLWDRISYSELPGGAAGPHGCTGASIGRGLCWGWVV